MTSNGASRPTPPPPAIDLWPMSIGFVGFSDDGRLALVFRFGIAVFVLVIVLVGVSRRQDVAHDGREATFERGEHLGDALGHVGSLLHEGRANSGGAQSPLGWVGRFLHFSEIPQGALTEAVAVEFTQPSHRDDPQRDNVPRGFCYPI